MPSSHTHTAGTHTHSSHTHTQQPHAHTYTATHTPTQQPHTRIHSSHTHVYTAATHTHTQQYESGVHCRYNSGHLGLLSKSNFVKGQTAVSQCAKAASAFELPSTGLHMMDDGAAAFEGAIVNGSKLNVESRERPRRAPIRQAHGRYSSIKMQAVYDIYVECAKSLEATCKALALSHVFWFESTPNADAIVAPSTVSLWLLWIGHHWWKNQNAHVSQCLAQWKGSYNTDDSERGATLSAHQTYV
jgi:hypothetical protein